MIVMHMVIMRAGIGAAFRFERRFDRYRTNLERRKQFLGGRIAAHA